MDKILALTSSYIEEHEEEMFALIETLVNIESGNSHKEGCDKMGHTLKEILDSMGVTTKIIPMTERGGLLCGYWCHENVKHKEEILLCGHMDTVFPTGTLEKRPFKIENDIMTGPGCLDMKSGLVIGVYVLKALISAGYNERPIKIIFAGDEENGHRSSTASAEIMERAKGCKAAFNFETGFLNDGLVVSRKGSCRLLIEVKGVAAHSGNAPENGRNAIWEMSHKVIALQNENDYENGTSINVGVISGGTVPNMVPDYCKVEVDIRYTKLSNFGILMKRVKEIIKTNYVEDTITTLTVASQGAIMEQSESNMWLFNHVKSVSKQINYGYEPVPIQVGGWSDACLIASVGVPVVCGMGAKGEHNHSLKEYALASSIVPRAKLVAASIILLDK